MKDNELIKKEGFANVRWCEKCQERFLQYPTLDEILIRYKKPIVRKCCKWRTDCSGTKRVMNRIWPSTRHIDQVYPSTFRELYGDEMIWEKER